MKYILIPLLLIIAFNIKAQLKGNSFPEIYNIVWNSQSKDASASMPVGGGDIGCNVWVEDDDLLIYFQRSGIHDEFNGFPKLGRVRLWTEPNIFKGATTFHQELKLVEGSIEIKATNQKYGDIRIKIWVEINRPIIHIETSSEKKLIFYTQYESWRTNPRGLDRKSELGERWGWWDIEGWNQEAILEPDQFKQDEDGMAFYHVNPDDKLASKLAFENMGLGEFYEHYTDPLKDFVWGGWITGTQWSFEGKYEGKYQSTGYTGWRYRTKKASKRDEVSIVLQSSYSDTGGKWLEELEKKKLSAVNGVKQAWKKNQEWWKNFWERSHLVINPEQTNKQDEAWQAGRNYNLFRFMTACNASGGNPTMFNGGLFTFDPELVKGHTAPYHPDWRRWGGGNYTLQNQRWIYWPMLKWGDKEHMKPMFDFFIRSLEVAELRVRQKYGHDGCLFPEPASVYGLPSPMLYGYDSSYLKKRQRTKWMDPGISRSVAIRNHHTATLEFAYMILEYHRYSGEDITSWLPFVKSTLTFYDQHYRMQAEINSASEYDINGKLVLFPTSACENYFYTTNPVTDVSGLRAVVEAVINLPKIWIDNYFGGEQEIQRLYKTLPEIHYEYIDGEKVIPPAQSIAYPSQITNNELYLAYPMFPFNQIKLGDEEMNYVHNTYKHYNKWTRVNNNPWEVFVSWTYGNVAFARMGMTEKATNLAYKKLSNGPYRFPSFWGPGYDWAPDFNWGGSGVVGVQEMLIQTVGDKIVLLPAWPKEWSAYFKFHAPKNTIVEGDIENGKIINLLVTPKSRKKDVIIWNEELNSEKDK